MARTHRCPTPQIEKTPAQSDDVCERIRRDCPRQMGARRTAQSIPGPTFEAAVPPNAVLEESIEQPAHLPPTNRKRRRGSEDNLEYTVVRSPKRPRSGHRTYNSRHGDETDKAEPIAFWAKEGRWPQQSFEPNSSMDRILARKKPSRSRSRKRSAPGSTSSATPSDQKPREEKSAPYHDPRYRKLLETRGSFMDDSLLGISDDSRDMTTTFLSSEQTFPGHTLFRDSTFKKACRGVEDRNEARVIRDITPLLVPSAELFAINGATELERLIESTNEGWNNSVPLTGTRPQPDYSVGFRREAFTEDQLEKLSPFIGDWIAGDQSFFMATYLMYFPFLTCEVKCGATALDVADRQNAHSMTLAIRAVVELFRLVKREKELDRKVLGFSVSHDHRIVRLYGHYPVVEGKDTKFYRNPIRTFDFTDLEGKDRWSAYRFVKNVYDLWMPKHFRLLCSAIDQLPSQLDFGLPTKLQEYSLSQDLEG
ncbi:hypothetical protein TOPH_08104 [Tolypocladium ophioglossoides CBS 100239]|uniref:DUF7924 domain-containing protein n=1 Tax=Tolypocladium ophioglossoides (strain CBS 100239) TaxID=1163406 RepID=A0A0L0N0C3_TOLOC|nr:hypothetical protein TOPH_08104 [Tolypocladium ophioglossoides CBS 100239]